MALVVSQPHQAKRLRLLQKSLQSVVPIPEAVEATQGSSFRPSIPEPLGHWIPVQIKYVLQRIPETQRIRCGTVEQGLILAETFEEIFNFN